MSTMVALVGEQPLPNFLPVRHSNPDNVLFVYSTRTKQTYERLRVALENEVHVYGLESDAYDINTVVEALNKKLDEIELKISYPLIFNFTGGTKMMSLAACLVAQQKNAAMLYVQSEGKQTWIYHYTWENNRLILSDKETMRECINLHDVLNLQLGKKEVMWYIKEPRPEDGGGHLFELAIARAFREHAQDYEVLCGVKDLRNQMDIDVMIRHQNHIAIIEAKTGGDGKGFKGIKQLSNNMRYLAGTYTKQFLVINQEQQKDQEVVSNLLRINIISLLNYKEKEKQTVLTQEDVNTLLSTIDNQMKLTETI